MQHLSGKPLELFERKAAAWNYLSGSRWNYCTSGKSLQIMHGARAESRCNVADIWICRRNYMSGYTR